MSDHKTIRGPAFYTPTIRGAYFYINEKRTKDSSGLAIPEENQKYEFVGLIPKLDRDPGKCANYSLFASAAMGVVAQVTTWGGQFPAGGNWPIKDGDEKVAKYPWMAGHWVINFSANYAPAVMIQNADGKRTPVPARRVGVTDIYKSGDYVVASVKPVTYDRKSRGVKFDFEGVLFMAPGEAIGMTQRSGEQIFQGLSFGGAAPVAPLAPPPGLAPAPQFGQPAAFAPPVVPGVAPLPTLAPFPTR